MEERLKIVDGGFARGRRGGRGMRIATGALRPRNDGSRKNLCVIPRPVRRLVVGSEPSAASGRGSEVSEWPRSKFPASAVRQRRNFGHRNRVIRNTPAQRTRRTDCHTSDIGHWFAMTYYKKCGVSPDGRTEASAPTEAQQEVQWAGDRKGRPYGSVTRSAVGRADVGIGPYGVFTDRAS